MVDFVPRLDIDMVQGSDFITEITVNDSGSPRDFTNWSAEMDIRTAVRASATAAELSTTNGRITFNSPATDGKINLFLPNTVTATLNQRRYKHDLELTDPSGIKSKLFRGNVNVTFEVTRA